MESVIEFYWWLVGNYGLWGLLLSAVMLLLLLIQLYYYLVVYARIVKYRNTKRGVWNRENTPISVIILMGDNSWYLENVMPLLMAQDYAEFEVVVVEVGTTEDFSHELINLKHIYPNLSSTKIEQTPKFPISDKMAYNVGAKAARYENIVITTTDARPASQRWLSCMAKGFENGDVVLGYCGIERVGGVLNKFIRSSRLLSSVRYLSSAVKGRPYRGIVHNMGFTRKTYFEHKGFNHLSMNVGVDDLFIQHIASGDNTSVVMNPHATVRQMQPRSWEHWWQERRFNAASVAYYPRWAKRGARMELGSRMLFYIAVIVLVIAMPMEIKIGAGVCWLGRASVVRYKVWRIRKRLGEKGLGWMLSLYDIIEPVIEIWLRIVTKLTPPAGIWR